MHFPRKLMSLATATIAAITFATPASATDQVQVVDEDMGVVCGAIVSPHTSGGCVVHAAGTIALELFVFGFESGESRCDVELEMRVSGSGVGVVDDMDLYRTEVPTDSTCTDFTPTVYPCDLPWEGQGEEDDAPGVVQSNVAVCIDPIEGGICTGTLSFDVVEGGVANVETYSTVFSNARIGTSACELTGSLAVEASVPGNADIHVNHP